MLKAVAILCVVIISSISTSCGGSIEPLLEVAIGEMAKDYQANAFRADEKYDRPLLVSGRVYEIKGSGTVQLAVGGYNHIEAEVKVREDLLTLNRGDKTALRCDGATGTTDTLGVFIYFEGCEVYESFDIMYHAQRAEGKSDSEAYEYAAVYSRLVDKEGKSRAFARAYVEVGGGVAEGRSDEYAYIYATLIEQGRSKSYANSYATEIIAGNSHEDAARLAERFEKAGQRSIIPRE